MREDEGNDPAAIAPEAGPVPAAQTPAVQTPAVQTSEVQTSGAAVSTGANGPAAGRERPPGPGTLPAFRPVAARTTEPPAYWAQAGAELAAQDPILREIIGRHPTLHLRSHGEPFATLARAVVGQQISVAASERVWERVLKLSDPVTPAAIAAVEDDALLACGLSRRKVGYLKDLALHFADGRLQPDAWDGLNDEAVIADLMRVKGIGRWTAEMYLIFNLRRPDVLPLGDFGLQRAMSLHYNRGLPLSKLKMRALGAAWAPWRSVATWYLWRSLDSTPVEY